MWAKYLLRLLRSLFRELVMVLICSLFNVHERTAPYSIVRPFVRSPVFSVSIYYVRKIPLPTNQLTYNIRAWLSDVCERDIVFDREPTYLCMCERVGGIV